MSASCCQALHFCRGDQYLAFYHISTLLPRNYEWWCISARKVCLVWKEISPPAKGCGTLRLGVEVFADSSNSSSNLWDFGPSRKIHVYCNLQFVRDALRSQKGLFLHSPPPICFEIYLIWLIVSCQNGPLLPTKKRSVPLSKLSQLGLWRLKGCFVGKG